jgi:CGNR zinc finger
MVDKVACPRCGKTIVECRRYPIEALAEFLRTTIPAACRRVGMSGTSEKDARCHGITRRVVDRVAGELHEHPSVIWPETIDHDIEDITAMCAAEDCDQRFVPRNRSHLFCSERCRQRIKMRRYRATPNGKAADQKWRDHYYDECGDYLRRRRKIRYYDRPDVEAEQRRRWRMRQRGEEAA